MKPTITPLSYTYIKQLQDIRVLNYDDIPISKENVKDQQVIYLGPKSTGGNHTHPRTEWFIAFGDLIFIWLDENGTKHEEPMNPSGQLLLFTVPPYLPHAVINKSKNSFGVLHELSDDKMKYVKPANISITFE